MAHSIQNNYWRNLKREAWHAKRASLHLEMALRYGENHPLHDPHKAAFQLHNALHRVYREIAVGGA